MGIYIPPGSGGNNNGNEKDNSLTNGQKSPSGDDAANSKASNPRFSILNWNSEISNFLQDNLYFGVNPSLGLFNWGPLVPPPENVMGLRVLTGIQFVLGVAFLNKSRLLMNRKLIRLGLPVNWKSRTEKYLSALLGASFILDSGVESIRLISPYDPWLDEREHYTQIAKSMGKPVHWWLGPMNYKPMDSKEFMKRLESWIDNRLEIHESKNLKNQVANDLSLAKNRPDELTFNQLPQSPILSILEGNLHSAAAKNNDTSNIEQSQVIRTKDGKLKKVVRAGNVYKLLNHEKFSQMYNHVRERNQEVFTELLENQLRDVNELNKAPRIDAILEGSGDVILNPNYSKPNIQLGSHRLETESDLDSIWQQFDPWEELKVETDYDIRLIPRWNRNEYESVIDDDENDTINSLDLTNMKQPSDNNVDDTKSENEVGLDSN